MRVAVQSLRPEPALVTPGEQASALSSHASRQRSSPVHASMSRAAISVPGTPHMISSASLWTFSRTRACSASASSRARREPVCDEENAGLTGEECRLPRLGNVRPASQVRSRSVAFEHTQSEIAQIQASSPHARARGGRRAPTAHPPRRNTASLSGLVARQRSQSSARQRSFGPRSAASVSSTISRMPARIRASSHGSSLRGSKSSGR